MGGGVIGGGGAKQMTHLLGGVQKETTRFLLGEGTKQK